MQVQLRPYGERALLVSHPRLSGLELRAWLTRELAAQRLPGLTGFVWGAENLLLRFGSAVELSCVESWFAALEAIEIDVLGQVYEIPVVYDGPDLDAIAACVGVSVEEVVRMHSDPLYTVRMLGFSPGFPYLDGLDSRLHLERRETPRMRIDPGSVAIGGPHAGIYSVASPGGWHLLGRTEFSVFDVAQANRPAVDFDAVFPLQPGDRIRFIAQ